VDGLLYEEVACVTGGFISSDAEGNRILLYSEQDYKLTD